MALVVISIGLVSAAGIVYYLFNKPHRDVQTTDTDFALSASVLVQEYLTDATAANQKYLSETGDSKVLEVTGKVHSVSRDKNNQWVVLLKQDGDKAGVSCTFTAATNAAAEKLAIGSTATIKGVIRSGAGYDADLELYEDVILEKCDVKN